MGIFLDLAYAIAAICSAPWWMWKRRRDWRQRLGHIESPPPPGGRQRILLHAVSVGEVNCLRTLVPMLARDFDVVISVTTDTGIDRARDLFAVSATVVRYPIDFSRAVRRFLEAVNPDLVFLTELELWPNFVRACRRRHIPIVIGNGRLSDRSFKRYRAVKPILGSWFRGLAGIAAQDAVYAERFAQVGADPERIEILGSMKWDAVPMTTDGSDEQGELVEGADALAQAMGIDPTRPLVVAGSTAPDEHALLREAMPPGTQLLCAPRRPEWFDDAAEDLPGCARRSNPDAGDPATNRFLLDTIGELRQAYALADVIVIGRSFGELFGSDPMEPAALGKPIVMGPADADFRDAVNKLKEAGGLAQTTPGDLPELLQALLDDEPRRKQMSEAALACVRQNQGASGRHAQMIRALISAQ